MTGRIASRRFSITQEMRKKRDVLSAATRALRPHTSAAKEVAAVILAVSVRKSIYPQRSGRKAAAARLTRISKRSKQATVYAAKNATMRWSRLLTDTASTILRVTGKEISPAYLALVGLIALRDLGSLLRTDLDERHGAIIYALWKRDGDVISQRPEELLPAVNSELRKLGKPLMGRRELHDRLMQLSELGSVRLVLFRWLLNDKVWLTT